ncbi:MAG: hypothetical protein FWC51_02220, partial [Proteobacteria bacterium]|nr:hypothetical protein [Pseudomonadota bacterium]
MRKSVLLFIAVAIAGACFHARARADDTANLDAGVETARAAARGPVAPTTGQQTNQTDIRNVATQPTSGGRGATALPAPAPAAQARSVTQQRTTIPRSATPAGASQITPPPNILTRDAQSTTGTTAARAGAVVSRSA